MTARWSVLVVLRTRRTYTTCVPPLLLRVLTVAVVGCTARRIVHGLRTKRTIIIGRDTRVRRRQRQRTARPRLWLIIVAYTHRRTVGTLEPKGRVRTRRVSTQCFQQYVWCVCAWGGRRVVRVRTIFNSVCNTQRFLDLKSENTGCYH